MEKKKILLLGGGAALLLLLLGSKKASAATSPPALPAPMPRLVPMPTGSTPGPAPSAVAVSPAPQKVDITATLSDADAARAAAAAVASATHAPLSAEPSTPAASPLTSVPTPAAASVVPAATPVPVNQVSPATPLPASTPSGPQLPSGYDPEAARRGAKAVANNVTSRKYDYDRRLVKAWQEDAGLAPDGVYGGATRGALIYYGVKNPPKPLFKPTETITYQPPG